MCSRVEFAVRHCVSQFDLQLRSLCRVGADRRLEEPVGAATGGLGRIHGGIGTLQQPEDIGAVGRETGDPDRGADPDRMTAECLTSSIWADRDRDVAQRLGAVRFLTRPIAPRRC